MEIEINILNIVVEVDFDVEVKGNKENDPSFDTFEEVVTINECFMYDEDGEKQVIYFEGIEENIKQDILQKCIDHYNR